MRPLIALLILTSPILAADFTYTTTQRADAERIARSKTKFVGPRLPPTKKSDSLATSIHRPPPAARPPKKPKPPAVRNRQVPPPRTYFDGKYFRDENGGVIAQKSGCRPCWMVRAGLHYRR
jgi:hypothetical protein